VIINGGSRSNGKWFGRHLTNGEKNEQVSLCDMRGVTGEMIGEAFLEMKAVASGTRCTNYFYHANINPQADEHLTPEQWEQAVDRLEKNLGLEGQARFVVEHDKHGRVHRHVIWSRIDIETMVAVKMTNDYAQHQATARELEIAFGLERGQSVLEPGRDGERPERRPEQWEVFRGKESGIDPVVMKEQVTDVWNRTDNGTAFKAGLEEQGYILARGDRRDFCIIDQAGHEHSLARRISGAKAKDIRERMADIDRASLPSVAEAKEIALERRRFMEEQDKTNNALRQREELAKAEAEKSAAIGKQEQQKVEAIAKDEDLKKQAIAEDQQRRDQYRKDEEQKAARAKELNAPQLQQQLDQQLGQLRELQQRRAFEDAYLAQRAREAEDAKRARQLEGDVTNAHGRYAQALGQHYDVRDPYGSLSRAAMTEHARFMQERQSLDRQLAQEKDPEVRKALELRKQIEAADYMAITDRRIAAQSEIITGKLNSPEAVKSRERAAAFEQEAMQLREQYREHQLAREKSHAEKPQSEKDTASAQTERQPGRQVTGERSTRHAPEPPLMVMDGRNGKQPVTLVEFVKTVPERSPAQDARMQNLERRREQQALENISQAMKAGKPLDGDDVKNLPRRDLDQIKQKGDAPLHERVNQHQQGRGQPRSPDKTPERERER